MSTSGYAARDGYVSVCGDAEEGTHLHVEPSDLADDVRPASVHLTVEQAHGVAAELLACAYGLRYRGEFYRRLQEFIDAEIGVRGG